MIRAILAVSFAALTPACILEPVVGGDCLPGFAACDGRCIDVRSDDANCGACGNVCAEGGTCIAGLCLGGGCELPEVWCDGAACADLATDPDNCGACGTECLVGERCSDGACVDSDCPDGTLECNGGCVDPRADPRHCGGCGQGCDAGTFCVAGDCEGGCPEGSLACDQMCVSPADDPHNCGECGVDCGPLAVCVAGQCEGCPTDQVRCGAACVDLGRDGDHCGACGTACDALDSCDAGTCVLSCPEELLDCRTGRCVDPAGDPDHCGGCDVRCNADESCLEGRCVDECGEGLTSCSRQCVDFTSDPDHCGGCGFVCDTGICEDGQCRDGEIGHLVLIGHDYAQTRRDQSRLVTNAALIPQGTVRVLAYSEYAEAESVRHVDEAIQARAGELGRTVGFESLADAQLLEAELLDADVLLLYAQTGAETETLEALGTLWTDALVAFLTRGGTIVALDQATTPEGGSTHRILVSAGLVAIDAATDATGQELRVTGAGDSVAAGMSASYRAEESTTAFVTDEGTAVVTTGDDVVVLHKVFLP